MSANNKKLQLRTPGLRLLAACALAVAVLGLWHGLDVRDGIARTGNRFLYGWYGAAFVWGMGLLAASGEVPVLPADAAFLGELSLSGATRGVSGVLPMR